MAEGPPDACSAAQRAGWDSSWPTPVVKSRGPWRCPRSAVGVTRPGRPGPTSGTRSEAPGRLGAGRPIQPRFQVAPACPGPGVGALTDPPTLPDVALGGGDDQLVADPACQGVEPFPVLGRADPPGGGPGVLHHEEAFRSAVPSCEREFAPGGLDDGSHSCGVWAGPVDQDSYSGRLAVISACFFTGMFRCLLTCQRWRKYSRRGECWFQAPDCWKS